MPNERMGFVVWLTGLPAAGKSTLASSLVEEIRARGMPCEVLDGDELRRVVSPDLGFTKTDRDVQVRRVAYIAGLLERNGVAVVVALVSPYRAARDNARATLGRFVEVFVTCPMEILLARDPKGLYGRARAGEVTQLSGIDDPYEPPVAPEVVVDTSRQTVEQTVAKVIKRLEDLAILTPEMS